jgi:hypothetical protein
MKMISSLDNFQMLSKMSTLSQITNKFFPNDHDIIEWRECFTKSCQSTLSPCYERLNNMIKKNETSEFFTLRVVSVEGIFKKLEVSVWLCSPWWFSNDSLFLC